MVKVKDKVLTGRGGKGQVDKFFNNDTYSLSLSLSLSLTFSPSHHPKYTHKKKTCYRLSIVISLYPDIRGIPATVHTRGNVTRVTERCSRSESSRRRVSSSQKITLYVVLRYVQCTFACEFICDASARRNFFAAKRINLFPFTCTNSLIDVTIAAGTCRK
ncbi:hypothetical protein P5V15_003361 [Pogonomyrmex californicus]